ncbi:MAG: adenine phosphoribosyltransferase [Actinomycetota bacterium]|nr:adenine phosphoribosyltransferase [Actinomycetota bacterium]
MDDPAATANSPLPIGEIARHVREVPDFPSPGISFKDITPLIEDGPAFHAAVDRVATATSGIEYDRVLSAEARGFVFGTALAYRARKGLILARKPGKLPRQTISAPYDLEYGSNTLHVHADSIREGTRVLVVDDLLATGGTARAMCQLVENAGGIVACVAFLIELRFLNGREVLAPYPVTSLLSYDA